MLLGFRAKKAVDGRLNLEEILDHALQMVCRAHLALTSKIVVNDGTIHSIQDDRRHGDLLQRNWRFIQYGTPKLSSAQQTEQIWLSYPRFKSSYESNY